MKKKVCILIATYKRKLSLIKLLNSLSNLIIPNSIKIQILICANDNQDYSELDKLFKKKLNIKFTRERRKGISFARNKSLKENKYKNYEYFAFLDDDTIVDKKWLIEMIKFIKNYNADIVGGPQLTNSPSLFNHLLVREENHGSEIQWASTNNCFFKKKVLKNNLKFSKKLNLIGGEDQLFFLLLKKKGYKICWNQKAKVFEQKNIDRQSLYWFLKRNFRYGASSSIIYKSAYGSLTGLLVLFLKLFFDFCKSFFYFVFLFTFSKKNFYKFLMYISRFTGSICGLFGLQYIEYDRKTSSS